MVALGVSGGIAAYKACEIVRGLDQAGAGVQVLMTASGARFITPLTLQTDLSGAIDQFAMGRYEELPVVDEDRPGEVIALLRRQDVIAVYSARLLAVRKDGVGPA